MRLASTSREGAQARAGFSYPRFLEVQQRQQVFSDLAVAAGNPFTLTWRADAPEQVIGLQASRPLLPTLGLQRIVGRNFAVEEERGGGPRVVLIGEPMWQQRFNGERSALARTLTLDGVPYTIIGVRGYSGRAADAVSGAGVLPASSSAAGVAYQRAGTQRSPCGGSCGTCA